MRILVTGSSGQVGTNLCLALIARGVDVLGLDRRPNTWTDKIPMLQCNLGQAMPTSTELAEAKAGFDQPDLVVHLAANAKVHELVKNPTRAHKNTTICFHVLEFCRLKQIPIIFSSSREVYGRPQPPKVTEDMTNVYHVLSPYAAYKLADEMLIYSYAHCYDLKYLIFRLSNVYGRYDNDLARMTRVIHIFIDQMLKEEPITIFDPTKIMDFTYIDDCINCFLLGIEKLMGGEVYNETINMSSESPTTLGRIAEAIAKHLQLQPEIINESIRPGEINFYIADLEKAKTLLGYNPQMPIEEGIKRAIDWSLDWQKKTKT